MRDQPKEAYTKPAAECKSCGCGIYEGDSTYKTHLGYFCPECIRESFTVCRAEDDDTYGHITESEIILYNMKASRIRLNRKDDKN